jgi:hippurate hydrolase
VVGGAAVVTALQTIVSRRVAPGEPAVVSVGTFEAGGAPNVIPASARLSGTVRAMDERVRTLVHREVERIAREVGGAYGLTVEVEVEKGTAPLVNTAREAAWARRAAERLLGPDAVRPLGMLNMAGEDFATYLERMPGCFLRIGARRSEAPVVPAHSPRFLPADESVVLGAALLAEVAREASAGLLVGGGDR